MKSLVVVAREIADRPLGDLGGRTPLEAAHTPFLDRLASKGLAGGWLSSASGQPLENILWALLGLEDRISGAVLDAAGAGIELQDEEIAFRADFVCLKPGATNVVMFDPAGCGVSDEEGGQLVDYLMEHLATDPGEHIRLHPIGGHRAVLTYRREGIRVPDEVFDGFSSPYDIVGESIDGHIPVAEGARRFVHIVNDSQMILASHPRMREKRETSIFSPNSLWLWGGGRNTGLVPLSRAIADRKAAFISGDPAIMGMARICGAKAVRLAGGKCAGDRPLAKAVGNALGSSDFVLLVADGAAGPSERGDGAGKIAAIEAFDSEFLSFLSECRDTEVFRILFLTDCIASTEARRRVAGPVPFAMADCHEGRLSVPPPPSGLFGFWAKISGQWGPGGRGGEIQTFSERLCEASRPLTDRALRERLLAA